MKNKINLNNAKIVITGAARGLGRCMATDLIVKENAMVIAIDRDEKMLKSLKDDMDAILPGRMEIYVADLTNEKQIRETCQRITNKNDVDGLINNAGLTDFGESHINRLETYRTIYNLNVMGTITMSLLFLEYFKDKNKGGFIYNISSLTAMVPVAYQNIYSSSKHALQSFTYGLIEEQRGKKIFIGIFAPGGMQTPMFEESGLSRHFGKNLTGIVKPEIVAYKALKNLKRKKIFSTATFFDAMCVAMIKFAPGSLSRSVMRKVYES